MKRAAKKNGHGGARKGAGRKMLPRKFADYAGLGEMPEDEADAMRWMFRALSIGSQQIVRDQRVADDKRRSELRSNAKVMHAIFPMARRRKAEKLIRGEADEAKRARAGAKVEQAPGLGEQPAAATSPAPAPGVEPAPPAKGDA